MKKQSLLSFLFSHQTNMPTIGRGYSINWIRSSACDWPSSVKEQAVLVIKLRADLSAIHHRFVQPEMLSPEKASLGERLADKQQELANAYRNLSKEIAFH